MVLLFAAAYPLAAPLALLNNLFEGRSDVLKLLFSKRPFPKRVASIGAWTKAFSALGYASAITNSAIIGISLQQAGFLDAISSGEHGFAFASVTGGATGAGAAAVAVILAGLVAEHVLVLLKILVEGQIPDMKASVRDRILAEAVRRPAVARLALSGGSSTVQQASAVASSVSARTGGARPRAGSRAARGALGATLAEVELGAFAGTAAAAAAGQGFVEDVMAMEE